MIGLLIQDNAYEQDIRELLMSFYPGELYAHELKDDLEFYVETALGMGRSPSPYGKRMEKRKLAVTVAGISPGNRS